MDEQGDIYLSFECPEMTDASRFTWCKSYEEVADDEKFRVETVGDRCVARGVGSGRPGGTAPRPVSAPCVLPAAPGCT